MIFYCKTVTRICKNAFKTVFYRHEKSLYFGVFLEIQAFLKERTERDSNIYKASFLPIYSLLYFSYGILVWNAFLTDEIVFIKLK